MKGFESNKVLYTSDVIKCTVERAEKLPPKCRKSACIFEVQYDGITQPCSKRQVDGEGNVTYAALLAC